MRDTQRERERERESARETEGESKERQRTGGEHREREQRERRHREALHGVEDGVESQVDRGILEERCARQAAAVGERQLLLFFFITLGLELSDTRVYEP